MIYFFTINYHQLNASSLNKKQTQNPKNTKIKYTRIYALSIILGLVQREHHKMPDRKRLSNLQFISTDNQSCTYPHPYERSTPTVCVRKPWLLLQAAPE